MLNEKEARARVQSRIDEFDVHGGVVVVDEETQEHEWGWVFFYQSRLYLESKKLEYALAGNASLIVNRRTGDIVETGTADPPEHYIREYERTLQAAPQGDA